MLIMYMYINIHAYNNTEGVLIKANKRKRVIRKITPINIVQIPLSM